MEDFSKKAFISKLKKQKSEKTRLEEECRELWRFLIYLNANFKCEYPGCNYNWGKLDAHHYYSKGAYPNLRFDLKNGIALCAKHHTAGFGKESAHSDPLFRDKILGKIEGYKAIRTESWDNLLQLRSQQKSYKMDLKLEKIYLIQELKKYKEQIKIFSEKINIDLINKYNL